MATPPLPLVLVFHLDQRPGLDKDERQRRWQVGFSKLIGALHHNPAIKAGLVLAGELVEDFAESHPEGLEWIRELVQRGQVELLATPLYEPVLSAIPERDGTAQIQRHLTLVKKLFGTRPRGCWLPHRVWDPAVPRVMAAAEIAFSFVDDVTIEPEAWGVYRTEREGQALALLPVDTQVTVDEPVKTALQHLRRRSNREHRGVTLAFSAATFGLRPGRSPEADQTWLGTFLAGLSRLSHAITLTLPSDAVANWTYRGRVYLPSSAPEHIGVPWERHLLRYEEANRLHKKMLRVSRTLDKLDRAVKEGLITGSRPDPTALVQAQRYLYRAQRAEVYWHGRHAGVYDPASRALAYRDLLRAERVAMEAVGTDERVVVETADLDGDGVDEVRMRTPSATIVIDPARGATVSEFSLYATAQNLVDTLTRIAEPYHADVIAQAAAGTEPGADARQSHPGFTTTDLRMSIQPQGRDRYPRLCFLDHFLGPEVTLEDMRKGTYVEAGRPAEGAWKLVTADRHDEAGSSILTHEVQVVVAGGQRRAVVTKRYLLAREPVLEMKLEIDNRDHDALRSRLAVVLNLTMSPDASQQTLVLPEARVGIHQAGEVEKVERLRLEGPLAALSIEIQRAARLWHFPIETVHQHDGVREAAVQGLCLVLLWPVELWGKESDKVRVTLTAHT